MTIKTNCDVKKVNHAGGKVISVETPQGLFFAESFGQITPEEMIKEAIASIKKNLKVLAKK